MAISEAKQAEEKLMCESQTPLDWNLDLGLNKDNASFKWWGNRQGLVSTAQSADSRYGAEMGKSLENILKVMI